MIATAKLEGYRSLRALNAFHVLMLGLKMLPAYVGEQYEEFFDRVSRMEPEHQEKLIREAALFVELQKEEVEALLSFCVDPNGVPYGAANLKSLGPKEIHECIVAVCMQIAAIKVDLIGDAQKKK